MTDTNSLVPPEGAREHLSHALPPPQPPAFQGSHFPENKISSPPAAHKTLQDLPHPLRALASSLFSSAYCAPATHQSPQAQPCPRAFAWPYHQLTSLYINGSEISVLNTDFLFAPKTPVHRTLHECFFHTCVKLIKAKGLILSSPAVSFKSFSPTLKINVQWYNHACQNPGVTLSLPSFLPQLATTSHRFKIHSNSGISPFFLHCFSTHDSLVS